MYILAHPYSCPDLRPVLAALPGAVPATTGNSVHIGDDYIGRTMPQHYPTVAVPADDALAVRKVFAAILRYLKPQYSAARYAFYKRMLLPQLRNILEGRARHVGLDVGYWDSDGQWVSKPD